MCMGFSFSNFLSYVSTHDLSKACQEAVRKLQTELGFDFSGTPSTAGVGEPADMVMYICTSVHACILVHVFGFA